MRRTLPIVLLVGAATLAGCGGTANVEGDFSINVANRENGCGFDNWDGNTAANIPVGITQDGESATATVGGLTATFLDLWLGGHVFNGSVDGSHLDLTLTGTRAQSQGACAYTYDAVIDADIDGDVLTGEIRYEAKTNGQADCGTLNGCASVQELNGARPPT